jgi:ornithine cyclodeaminase/alanine dehydrogenase-like protein (mu-crystallin family)
MTVIIPFHQGEQNLDWRDLCHALDAGHLRPKAEVQDSFLYRGADTLLTRSAWIDGLGIAVKAATVFPDNPAQGRPMIGGAMNLLDDADGSLAAVVDFHLVTKWKTAGDSLCAAIKLARPDSQNILIVGTGTVGASLYDAYSAGYPKAAFTVWNRTPAKARSFAQARGIAWAEDLETAIRSADIVTSATMSTDPLIMGDWLQPGQHIDLIGAYRRDMREADDTAIQRARLFVDNIDTTLNHIGELRIPLAKGVITPRDIVADFYQPDAFYRTDDTEITLFKNGGGAHLDLMCARYIFDAWSAG